MKNEIFCYNFYKKELDWNVMNAVMKTVKIAQWKNLEKKLDAKWMMQSRTIMVTIVMLGIQVVIRNFI